MVTEETALVQGVLFDMDGVLVSSVGSATRCWRKWAAHYGVPHADQVQIQHGTRAIDIMEQLKPGVDQQAGLRRTFGARSWGVRPRQRVWWWRTRRAACAPGCRQVAVCWALQEPILLRS